MLHNSVGQLKLLWEDGSGNPTSPPGLSAHPASLTYLNLLYITCVNIIMPAYTAGFDTIHPLFCDGLSSLINKFNKTNYLVETYIQRLAL